MRRVVVAPLRNWPGRSQDRATGTEAAFDWIALDCSDQSEAAGAAFDGDIVAAIL